MNHLVKFKVFEANSRAQNQTPQSQYLPRLGEVDPQRIAAINGNKNPKITSADRERISNDRKNWFEKIGSIIEKLGGSYIKDPMQWRTEYKAGLPKNAFGNPIDSGFSDILGWGGAATKGITSKVFGSSEEAYQDPAAEFGTTVEHHRVYLDNLQKKNSDVFKSPSKYADFAANEYKKSGRYFGQDPAFDDIMLAGKYRADAASMGSAEAGLGAEAAGAAGAAGLGSIIGELAPIVAVVP